MYKFILFLGIRSAFASGSQLEGYLSATHSPKHRVESSGRHLERPLVPDNNCHKIVACHYINNQNEQDAPTLNIEMIDVNLCTHLFYSSASLLGDTSIELDDVYTDIQWDGFKRINNLRNKNRRLETIITIGEYSWAENGSKFGHKIIFDPELREKIVDNIVAFVRKYEFNGIELESHYLAAHIALASDKQNFVSLLKALKEKFDENQFILALAVDGYERTANNYDIREISKYVSFINLKAYGFHGNSHSNHNRAIASHIAPLYHSSRENTEEQKLNVDHIVRYWLSRGTPPNKLILGTTFNGEKYTLANPQITGRGAPVVVDPRRSFAGIRYYFTCQWEKKRMKRMWKTLWDEQQQVAYIIRKKAMIAYENVASIRLKAAYAKRMQLGGVFAYSIEGDDFSGHCGGEEYPLLKAMIRVLRGEC